MSPFLLSKCLENAIKKETELPKLITKTQLAETGNEIVKNITGKSFVKEFDPPTKKMRSAEDILKDYGLGGVKNG